MPARSASQAQTGAERQRAYRARHKGEIKVPKRQDEPAANDDEQPDEAGEVSLASLNARMRRMAAQALNDLGGVEYLKRIGRKSPNTFLRFASQFVTKEDLINPGAFRIYVQKLTIEAAVPVAGVLASPVAGHIAQQPALEILPALPREDGDA